MSFRGLREIRKTHVLNRFISKPHYILLIHTSRFFELERDLQLLLRLKSKPISWFLEIFKQWKVHVHYFTLFTTKERFRLGPITKDISESICKRRIEKIYHRHLTEASITLVGPAYLKHKIKGFNIISCQDFVSQILHNGS